MVRHLIAVWLCLAAGIAVAAKLIDSVEVHGGTLTLLGVAALFGLVNGLIGPLLRLLSLPLLVVTFGLFALVVNGALLAITAWLTDALDVGGFLSAIWAALVISVVSAALNWVASRIFVRGPAR